MTRRVPLKEARAGMVLSADAVNTQQMLLLRKGTTLTAQHLRMLKSWGVIDLDVERLNAGTSNTTDASNDHLHVGRCMTARFGDTLQDPVMSEICRSATRIVSLRRASDT